MSTLPYTTSPQTTIDQAIKVMKEHHIRHLPVEDSGHLVGVVTDGDINLAASFSHVESLLIDDVMTRKPYTIPPHTPIDHVVLTMAEHKYGCAIVKQDNGKIVGIFTANDALRVLGEILQGNFKPLEH